jgi:hypothetical protein
VVGLVLSFWVIETYTSEIDSLRASAYASLLALRFRTISETMRVFVRGSR